MLRQHVGLHERAQEPIVIDITGDDLPTGSMNLIAGEEEIAPVNDNSAVQQLLSIFTDMDRDYAAKLVTSHNYNIQVIANNIFENSEPYPKVVKALPTSNIVVKNLTTPRSVIRDESYYCNAVERKKDISDYNSYCRVALAMLTDEFHQFSVSSIKKLFHGTGTGLYLPTWKLASAPHNDLVYNKFKRSCKWHAKTDKACVVPEIATNPNPSITFSIDSVCGPWPSLCQDIYDEIIFTNHLKSMNNQNSELPSLVEGGIREQSCLMPCGCCFSDVEFESMVQCVKGHLFCRSCVDSYVSSKLGDNMCEFRCMSTDGDGCGEIYPEIELRQKLPKQTYENYIKVLGRKNVDSLRQNVNVGHIETCPNCEIEVEVEESREIKKYLICLHCSFEWCRTCNKVAHPPLSCEESAAKNDASIDDAKLKHLHAIEEEMSQALVRECPKCKQRFLKLEGCNKMTCNKCSEIICYLCRQNITKLGYKHFCNSHPSKNTEVKCKICSLCKLWTSANESDQLRMAEAAQEADKKYKAENPNAAVVLDNTEISKLVVETKRIINEHKRKRK